MSMSQDDLERELANVTREAADLAAEPISRRQFKQLDEDQYESHSDDEWDLRDQFALAFAAGGLPAEEVYLNADVALEYRGK